jgi:hypothetical protein
VAQHAEIQQSRIIAGDIPQEDVEKRVAKLTGDSERLLAALDAERATRRAGEELSAEPPSERQACLK